jgi:hypothetical protein
VPQGAVDLGLERVRKLRVSPLVINEGRERTLHLILERDRERVAGNGICTTVKKELNKRASQVSRTS